MRQPGRPKGNRRLEEDEHPRIKKRRKCSTCGHFGHNKVGCKGGAVGSNKRTRAILNAKATRKPRATPGPSQDDAPTKVPINVVEPNTEGDGVEQPNHVIDLTINEGHVHKPEKTRGTRGRKRKPRATDSPSRASGVPCSAEPPTMNDVVEEQQEEHPTVPLQSQSQQRPEHFMRPPIVPPTQSFRPPWRVGGLHNRGDVLSQVNAPTMATVRIIERSSRGGNLVAIRGVRGRWTRGGRGTNTAQVAEAQEHDQPVAQVERGGRSARRGGRSATRGGRAVGRGDGGMVCKWF